MADLLEFYQGALVGALVGDCLGAPFEFNLGNNYEKTMKRILEFIRKVDDGKMKGECKYTDDTAMLRSVANSLVKHKKLNAKDLSKRFSVEYFNEPNRRYGMHVDIVFEKLRDTKFRDPFGPAAEQFNGQGSFGNGGAMRIAPAALFGLHLSCEPLEDRPYSAKITKIQNILQMPTTPDVHDIVDELGNGVRAIQSVPSAVFSFLHHVDRAPRGWEKDFNNFQRTIIYAISLGGDTDTIASMAGAIAGAYHGINSIPKEWQEACEKLDEAKEQALQLYQLAEGNRKAFCSIL